MSEEKKTLSEEDIVSERSIGRRSTLGVIGASLAAMAGVLGIQTETAEAQCSDSDGGRNADPGGRGRHCGRSSGCSDSDGGRNADPGGRGRRCGRPAPRRRRPPRSRGCTDPDTGRYADGAGTGRRC